MNENKAPFVTVLLAGGSLLIYFGSQVGHDLPLASHNQTLWASVTGICLFIIGLIIAQSDSFKDWEEKRSKKIVEWLGVAKWQYALLIMSPAYAILAANAAGFDIKMFSPYVAVGSWILGIAMASIGGYQWKDKIPKPTKNSILLLASIMVLAFLLRGIATDRFPILLTGDEGSSGLDAAKFARGEWNNIFIVGWYSFPSFFFFIQSLFIRIFGQTIEALRIPSALAGAFTVAAVYIIGKKMFSARAGLLAALLLSGLHYHIHFSRIGLNNIWDGLWYTIVLGAIWHGWEHEDRLSYLVAGLGLGLSQYFYTSSRVMAGIILLWVVFAAWFQRPKLKRALPHFAITSLITVVIILPLAWFFIKNPNQFLAPMQRVSILGSWLNNQIQTTGQTGWQIIAKQLAAGLEACTYAPLLFWYTPETPILRPLSVPFFYIGLIFLILKDRNSRFAMLALWLVAMGIIGGLSDSTPAAQRYTAAAPACVLLVGYGIHKTTEMMENLWGKYGKVIAGAAYGFVVIIMISDLHFYFIEYTQKSQIDNVASNGIIAFRVATFLQNKPQGTQALFFDSPGMGYYSIPSIQYLAPQVTGVDVNSPWESFDRLRLSGANLVFVIMPEWESQIDVIRNEYSCGDIKTEKAWNGQVLYWIYDCTGAKGFRFLPYE